MDEDIKIGIIYRLISEGISLFVVFFMFLPKLVSFNRLVTGLSSIQVMGYESGKAWGFLFGSFGLILWLLILVVISAWYAKKNFDVINGLFTLFLLVLNIFIILHIWHSINIPIFKAAMSISVGSAIAVGIYASQKS